ncbi:unnamed protein product [Prorocentrum cordatum]|uniref:Uncharacterized protein n=1 Tax=Prorocentrum cordatum TaxID=2364126 RepID=A0ABN9Y9D2_9DINO|nr:unnamed protein product [Polarella glacialis]
MAFNFARAIIVKTEADLEKDLHRTRLLKRHAKSLSCMGAPDETGTATEKVYLFKPEATFHATLMESQKQAFEQQGQRVFEQGLNAMVGGDLSAFTAELGGEPGAAPMQTYSGHLRSEMGAPGDDGDGRASAIEVGGADVLEGVAAAAATPPPQGVPNKCPKGGCLTTSPRASAAAGGAFGGNSSSGPLGDAASLVGGSLGEDEDNLREGELLAHWNAKIS